MSQTNRYAGKVVYAVLALLVGVTTAATQTKTDPLKSGFENPPEGARPRVWWHWMNGNISKEGIKLDLEWMHRVGLGGYQNFDAALSTPQVVPKRLAYMTPEWKDAFKYAVEILVAPQTHPVHPLQVKLDAFLAGVAVHPMPPHARTRALRRILEATLERISFGLRSGGGNANQ